MRKACRTSYRCLADLSWEAPGQRCYAKPVLRCLQFLYKTISEISSAYKQFVRGMECIYGFQGRWVKSIRCTFAGTQLTDMDCRARFESPLQSWNNLLHYEGVKHRPPALWGPYAVDLVVRSYCTWQSSENCTGRLDVVLDMTIYESHKCKVVECAHPYPNHQLLQILPYAAERCRDPSDKRPVPK